jgi:hypothetical protein
LEVTGLLYLRGKSPRYPLDRHVKGLYLHRAITNTEKKHRDVCVPRVGIETTILVFEWCKAINAIDPGAHYDRLVGMSVW